MTRVLVTGASGLIGKPAVQALVGQGLDVHAVARTVAARPSDVTWHACDLLSPGAVETLTHDVQATHLLHLAWVTEHGQFWNAPQNADWQAASKRLIEAFQANGGKRVLMAGSCAEYDWTDLADGVCREGVTPLKPHTLYGQSKLETLEWLAGFAAKSALSYAWGRVFLLFGEGESDKRLVPSVASALAQGRVAKCSSGSQIRDFMDARDVGAGFAALLMSDVQGAVNVASGEDRTIGEVVTLLGEISGHPELVHLGALPDRADDPHKLVASVDRLHLQVGFKSRHGLRKSLFEVYQKYKDQN
jgi:nucleoside-diphosphate-sugar epimerase